MTRSRSPVIVGVLVLVTLGCGSDVASTAPQPEDASAESSQTGTVALAEARRHWSGAGITSYQLTVAEHRNYWSKGCTWITVVMDGVVSDTAVDDGSPTECAESEWTVEQLHEMVSRMIRDIGEFAAPEFGQHTLEVTFDQRGVPESVEFDLANGADEEASIRVTFTNLS